MKMLNEADIYNVAGGDTCGTPCDCICSPGSNYLDGDKFCCTFPAKSGMWVTSQSGPTVLQCVRTDGSYGAMAQGLSEGKFAITCGYDSQSIVAQCRQHIWVVPCNVTGL